MKSLVRFAIAGMALVIILTSIFIFLLSEPDTTHSEGIIFVSGVPTDIRSVTVYNESGRYNFYFDFDEGGYVLDDIPPHLADLEAFFDFMAHCAGLSAIRQISNKPYDLTREERKDWGLDKRVANVEIDFFDGNSLHLIMGGGERISGNFYAIVQGFYGVHMQAPSGVYLLPRAMAQQFFLPKTQILSKFVTPQLAVSSPLTAIRDITFTGGELKYPVTIQTTTGGSGDISLAALSFGAPTHIVRGIGTYQLDQTYGAFILGSLFAIPALDIAGYNLSDDDINAYGFDLPYMTIDYDMINGVNADTVRMRLKVALAEPGLYYVTLESSGAVYIIGREAFLDIEYERLMQRWFLTPMIMDLSAVTVTAPDADYRFEIDNTDSRNPIISCGGQVIDVDLFRSFFRLITSASHDGEYLGALSAPVGEALLTITYEYLNPDKPSDTLALYPGDVRRNNVFIDGAGEFAIKDLFTQRVLEGSANLIAGKPIEEEW